MKRASMLSCFRTIWFSGLHEVMLSDEHATVAASDLAYMISC